MADPELDLLPEDEQRAAYEAEDFTFKFEGPPTDLGNIQAYFGLLANTPALATLPGEGIGQVWHLRPTCALRAHQLSTRPCWRAAPRCLCIQTRSLLLSKYRHVRMLHMHVAHGAAACVHTCMRSTAQRTGQRRSRPWAACAIMILYRRGTQ